MPRKLAVMAAFLGLCSFLFIDFLATPAAAGFVGGACLLGASLLVIGEFNVPRIAATASVALLFLAMSPISTDPYITFRYSLLVVLTMAFPAMMSLVISKRAYLTTVAFILIIILPFHFIFGKRYGDGWQGLLSSKNYFSFHMSLTAFLSLYLVFSARRLPMFVLGAAGFVGGCIGIGIAGSAGAIIATVPAMTFFVVWMMYGRMGPANRGLFVVALAAVAVIGLFLLAIEFSAIRDAVLTAFSKDAGLTGRDYLWIRGRQYILDHPIFGYGYDAFWQQGNVEAEGLWRFGGIDSRSGFNFHNFYIHNLVEVGVVGFGLTLFFVVLTTLRLAAEILRDPTPESVFLFAILILFWERTYVEVDFPSQFGLLTFIIASAFAYSFRRPAIASDLPSPGALTRLS